MTWDARTKWCAGCARGIGCVGRWGGGGRTGGDAGTIGQAGRLRLTRLGWRPTAALCRHLPPRTPRRGRRPRRPFLRLTDDTGLLLTPYPSHRRGGLPRPPGVGCRTTSVRPCEMVRGLRPRDCIRWAVDGGGRAVSNTGVIGHAGHPHLPHPGSHATRGVEDAAPYGREENHSIRNVVNMRVDAASLRPPLGSPERGAVAALCAVTEGLVQRRCGVVMLPVNLRIPRRAGFHARPAWDEGPPRFARTKWCAGGAREIEYVG